MIVRPLLTMCPLLLSPITPDREHTCLTLPYDSTMLGARASVGSEPIHISKTVLPTIHLGPPHSLVCVCCRQSPSLETELLGASARLSIYPPIPGDQL